MCKVIQLYIDQTEAGNGIFGPQFSCQMAPVANMNVCAEWGPGVHQTISVNLTTAILMQGQKQTSLPLLFLTDDFQKKCTNFNNVMHNIANQQC